MRPKNGPTEPKWHNTACFPPRDSKEIILGFRTTKAINLIPGLTTSKVLTSTCTCNIPYPDGNQDYRLEYHNNILSNLINDYRKIFQIQILPPPFPPFLSFIHTGLLTKHEISKKTLRNLHSLFHNIHCALQLLTCLDL